MKDEVVCTDFEVSVGKLHIPHNEKKWRLLENRHPDVWNRPWGWVDGTTDPLYWGNTSNDLTLVRLLVDAHNSWLDSVQPLPLQILKKNQEIAKLMTEEDSLGKKLALVTATKDKLTEELNILTDRYSKSKSV